jgi:predicted ATPase
MVQISKVNLQNFKTHENLIFEPNNITIVTGKNNSGKTSLLEAIELCFSPDNVRRYEGLVEKLIRSGSNESTVRCEYSGATGQAKLTEFIDEGATQELTLKRLTDDQKHSVARQLFLRQINSNRGVVRRLVDEKGDENIRSELKSLLSRAVEIVFDEVRSDEEVDEYVSGGILVEQSGNQVPFLYFSDNFSDLIVDIADTFSSSISESSASITVDEHEVQWAVESLFRGLVVGRYGSGNFVGTLESNTAVKMVSELDITEKDIEGHEESSIVLSRVEDSIRKYNLLPEIKSFNSEDVVFNQDNQRHQIPHEFMGDGFRAITGLLWELHVSEMKEYVLLLEEPENSMHPGYIKKLVHFFVSVSREEDVQMMITTHDVDLINAFLNPTLDETESYLRKNLGILKIQKYAAQHLDFADARKHLNELHLDLRGE